jgi:hypothetical protein
LTPVNELTGADLLFYKNQILLGICLIISICQAVAFYAKMLQDFLNRRIFMPAKLKKDDTQPAKQVFNIKGDIRAGRDVIQGDQTNYITYNAQQIANLASPAEFLTVLQQVQAQIGEMKKAELSKAQERNLEVAESLVGEVVEEVQKPQPALERIKETLSEAKETMEMLSGSIAAATALGTILAGLAATAIKLFGG